MKNDKTLRRQYTDALHQKDLLAVRTIVCALFTATAFILSFFEEWRGAPIFQAVLCAALYAVCFKDMNSGAKSIFTRAPTVGALQAATLLTGFLHATYASVLFTDNIKLFTWILFLSFTILYLLKFCYVRLFINDLNLIRNSDKLYGVQVSSAALKSHYINRLCTVTRIPEFPEITQRAYSGDYVENQGAPFVQLALALCVLLSAAVFFIYGTGAMFAALSVLTCVTVCFSGEVSFFVPYVSAQKKLRNQGSVLFGTFSVSKLKKVNTLLLEDSVLFPQDCVNIENLSGQDKTQALQYAAALLKEINSPLAAKMTDSLYEDKINITALRSVYNYGLIAVINENEIHFGNRNLLLSYSMKPLSQEKEAELNSKGKSVMYLAINGKTELILAAEYLPTANVNSPQENENFNLLVETLDFNINEALITKRCNIPNINVMVTDCDEIKQLYTVRRKAEKSAPDPIMLTTQNNINILSGILTAKKLHTAIAGSAFTKKLGVYVGLVLTGLAMITVPMAVSPFWLLIYNILWTIAALAVSAGKY